MKRSARTIPAALAAVLLCAAAPHAGAVDEDVAKFLAGCEVLSRAVTVDGRRKAEAFRWLVEHTGVTPRKALKVVRKHRDRPKEWRHVLEAMRAALQQPKQ